MPPTPGAIHRAPRSDSGAARLWQWARSRQQPWTCPEAAEACGVAAGRCRHIVAAFYQAGIVDRVAEQYRDAGGALRAAEWTLSAAGRKLAAPPVLITDAGRIVGVRVADLGGTDILRRAIERSGLGIMAAAEALQIHNATLHKILVGERLLAEDDPVIERARTLGRS